MCRTIKLILSYEGTNYAGWQTQPDKKTIQGCIEDALKTIFKKRCNLYGAGRTDAGVHALGQVAHFRCSSNIPPESLKKALNSILPKDITVFNVSEEISDFHARKDATAKKYIYRIYRAKTRNPFLWPYAWHLPDTIDLEKIKACLPILQGEHDFTSFSVIDKDIKNGIRRLIELNLYDYNDMLIFEFLGTGFLRKQIRRIVGTLIDVGRGRYTPDYVKQILESKDPNLAGPTAPSRGLFLVNVFYKI